MAEQLTREPAMDGAPGPVPFNDLRRRVAGCRAALDAAARRVLDRGWFVHGPELAAFEAEFAAALGLPGTHVVGVGNGTDALELALKAVGVRAGDAVATVANAGGYASTALMALGARPVYLDIDPATMLIDPAAFARLVREAPPRALVVTHLYGRAAALDELVPLARAHGVAVVEDVAQAHGATYGGRPVGTWGDAAAFSFYPTKNLGALGDGGAVAAARPDVAAAARSLRQYGWQDKYHVARAGGRNSRLDELQAACLRVFLPLLPAWNARRRALAARYGAALAGLPLVLPDAADPGYVAHLYVVRSAARDALRAALATVGVGTDIHYPAPDYVQAFGHAPAGGLRETERAAREVFSLPLYPELADEEADRVAAAVRAACGAHRP